MERSLTCGIVPVCENQSELSNIISDVGKNFEIATGASIVEEAVTTLLVIGFWILILSLDVIESTIVLRTTWIFRILHL